LTCVIESPSVTLPLLCAAPPGMTCCTNVVRAGIHYTSKLYSKLSKNIAFLYDFSKKKMWIDTSHIRFVT
jgi:hypothetical protein